jgi:15-cis-phytoene synthase
MKLMFDVCCNSIRHNIYRYIYTSLHLFKLLVMNFVRRLLLCLVLNICSCWCWLNSYRPPKSPRIVWSIAALATPPTPSTGSSNDQTTNDPSGRVLEGGKIIDFSFVKASNIAEKALLDARQRLKRAHDSDLLHTVSNQYILGINDEVIEEVGHELATFATKNEIQECASYILSKASPGLMKRNDDGIVRRFGSDEMKRFDAILEMAYLEAGEVTSAFAKTFFMGTMLLGEEQRKAIWAIYVWCRRTDEIVDAPRDNNDDMLTDLSSWEMRLENLWSSGEVTDVYDLCLLDVRVTYPDAEIQPYLDMIRGMLMDVPDLGQDRYISFDDLHLYCYRVAGTVGLMSLPVFGCGDGYDYSSAR